jgi:hypothetical protein
MMHGAPPRRRSHDSNNIDLDPASHTDEEAQLLGRNGLNGLPADGSMMGKKRFWNVLHGHVPPRVQSIRPFFPSLQRSPIRMLTARGINQKVFHAAVVSLWLLVFILFLREQIAVKDGDGKVVVNVDCVDTLWRRKNECGLDGIDCRPFSNRSFAFRCPANCASVKILNPHLVGASEVNYRPLVIGAGPYRGDSFLCASAIHAGIVEDARGGCGRVTLRGELNGFASTKQNSIESVPFDAKFPLSFSVAHDDKLQCSADPRSRLLPVSLLLTAALAVFSTSPLIFFPIFVLIFAHVSFVSDPPSASYRNSTVLPDHVSMFAKRLLPAVFIAVVMYWTTIRKTLSGLTAQFEKALLWLGGFWIGALSNYTFDWIPISRLTAHDLDQQPGAKLALAVIILLLLVVIVGQAYYFWLEGRMLQYLGLYGLFVAGILICLGVPGVNLRIHHYILALLLLPGTSLQTRPSLLYQGILLGLFVNGVARWDFDSVLQTSDALLADAGLDSVVPAMLAPTITSTSTAGDHLVALFATTPVEEMDGLSMLVNDVERVRMFYDDEAKPKLQWRRPLGTNTTDYFRWAYLKDGRTLDYSAAGTWLGDGKWSSAGK